MARLALPRRSISAPLALLALLAVVTGSLALYQTTVSHHSRDWVLRSHEVIEAAQVVFSHAQDVESGARGYTATGDELYLEDYKAGIDGFPAAAARLTELVADNPDQSKRAERLTGLLSRRIDLAKARVDLGQSGRLDIAAKTDPRVGKQAMDEAREALNDLVGAEQQLLAERTARSDRTETAGVAIALITGALAIAGLIYLFVASLQVNRGLRREVDAREAAETGERKASQLYSAVFENAGDYLFVLGSAEGGEFRLLDGNRLFAEGIGLPIERLRGRTIRELNPGALGDELQARYERVVATGEALRATTEVPLRGGVQIWESTLVPVAGEDGRVDRIVGVSRDITERVRLAEQRTNAQKMEAIGHLTGGVAHDFNNLLQVIRGNLDLLAPLVHGSPGGAQRLQAAVRGVDRAASLTRHLLAFARRQPLEPRPINLARLVGEMGDMFARTLGEAVEVETHVQEGLWTTLADPAQVESAVLNLALNARDAMQGKGKLTLELGNTTLDAAYIGDEGIEAAPGDYVRLTVSDTGCGMDEETLTRVFEPFFSTKGPEHGTGLGLSMVYGFVRQSHGHVQIYSEVGEGTTVKILLPRVEAEEEAGERPAAVRRGANEVILIVEDEEAVRATAHSMLEEMGYACLEAENGDAALKILQSGAKIDLLFTDVVMPGQVTPRELAAKAQALIPGLPILFTSGYTEDAIVHHGRLDEGVALISKPYQKDDLARKVRALLDGGRRTVLVVEDEGLVRMAAVDMIETLGFCVIEAADGAQAMEALESEGRIDILFTDVGLPDIKGSDLAEAALKCRPGLKVVYASGYGGGAGLPDDAIRLSKPYDQDDLDAALSD